MVVVGQPNDTPHTIKRLWGRPKKSRMNGACAASAA
jgi:hypothetical protein